MYISQVFDAYLKHVLKYRKLGTYKYYQKNFNVLIPIMNHFGYIEASNVDELFFENITDYFLDYTSKKKSKINDAISCIITAFNFKKISYPIRYKLLDDTESFKALSEVELDKLLIHIKSLNLKVSNNLSWALAICLYLDTGVRLSELLDIKFKNIDFDRDLIMLDHTKNGEQRCVFFYSLSRELLMMAKRKRTEYVLWNYEKGEKLNARSLEHFFDKLNEAIKPDERIHAHRLRKTFATRLYRKGCPIITISKILGHKDIRQTMIYIEVDTMILEKDYKNYYPY